MKLYRLHLVIIKLFFSLSLAVMFGDPASG